MDLIKEINEKYQALEAEIDKKLEKVQTEEQRLERQYEKIAEKSAHAATAPKQLSYEEALKRNANTLKSLEVAKARLRSRTTYSPVEKILQRALDNYNKELRGLQQQSTDKSPKSNVRTDEQEHIYELVMELKQ
ncbi:CG13949 [Drosophila busckii]|uniref:CG13949 n=1 Tax=Drosophila busckii TaxID=30019 RepID=A0A0M3QSY0_DROBS|nr:CG13949 [Drosophila busckii]